MTEDLSQILSAEKPFRKNQIYTALFNPKINSFAEITTLSTELKNKLTNEPWMTVKEIVAQKSKTDDTTKSLLGLADGQAIETVLMGRSRENKEDRHTICVSTQVGCPMNCAFCATGKLGFCRNLTAREIIDQYRYWQKQISPDKIDNIVIMGMGEPLLNYDNVKEAINTILTYTEIGQAKITLSTAGVPAALTRMLTDADFPAVRFSISLHSAIEKTRAKIMPSHQKGFLDFFIDWSKKYHITYPSRAHFIGIEYVMLSGVNDDQKHLNALIKMASNLGRTRVNLIPYNQSCSTDEKPDFIGSPKQTIEHWRDELMQAGFVCTIRVSHGQDIAAACGQLAKRNM